MSKYTPNPKQVEVQKSSSVTITKQELHVRPLPSPEDLNQYELVKPGFAERLLQMAEKEQDRRLTREDKLLEMSRTSINLTRLGLILGFLSVIVMASLCGYVAYLGDTKSAATIAGVVIIGLAAVFVTRRFFQKNTDKEQS